VDLNNRRRDRNDVLETPRPAGGDTGRAGSKDMANLGREVTPSGVG
jgi:hypothetical protein